MSHFGSPGWGALASCWPILLANPASIPSHRRLADRNGRVFEARGLVGIRPVYESTALKLINEREIRKMPCSA